MFTEEATEDFSDPFRRLGNYEGDPVYNSPLASERLRRAIRERQLQGMTPERFLARYRKVFLDTVPDRIDDATLEEAGYKKDSYAARAALLKLCRDYGFTRMELFEVVGLKREYDTSFDKLRDLLDRGFSTEDAGYLLEVRKRVKERSAKHDRKIGLMQLVRFCERFPQMPLDADYLDEKIAEICEATDHQLESVAIYMIMRIADRIRTSDIDTALDFRRGRLKNRLGEEEEKVPDVNKIIGSISWYKRL